MDSLKLSAFIGVVILLLAPSWTRAESFVVENIEVIGIKKITVGTVFNYLPVNVGETFDEDRSAKVLRELYSTGFFNNIELLRRDNILVVKVVERPSIAEVNFTGNDDIEDEALNNALDQVGMSKGRIFNEHKLDKLELELQQVYYSLGKYAARITTEWRNLDENRVAIDIDISEGVSATILSINFTGNNDFDDKTLLDLFELEPSSEGYFASDEYSGSKLAADLESLKSYYLDRGYIKFEVVSQQVTIDPERKDIGITVNIKEGDQYTLKSIELSGEMVVDEAELNALIGISSGVIFSRKEITRTITAMKKRLGEDGYAYAEIRALTETDETDNSVELKLVVLPGNKMRVRHISFLGNDQTQDIVLRREMRQFEGDMFQQSKVDRSRVRLQRLNYLGSATIRLVKVEDSNDQLDLEISVTERFSGNLQVGVGYSQEQGATVNLGFTHENIFGSGKKVDFTFDNSAASERYRFGYENPYYTEDGISRGFNLTVTRTDASENNISNYLIDVARFTMDFGIPLSEYNELNLATGFIRNNLSVTTASSDEVFDFIINSSDKYNLSTAHADIDEETYDSVFASVSFAKDTRNRRIFADSGHLNNIKLELNSGDLDFYKIRYLHQTAFALSDTFTFAFKSRVGYGESIGDVTQLPIFEKFTAGGVRSVRGYRFNSLGPKDSNNDPFGGDLQVISTAEILFPIESLGSSETFRLGIYFDAGSVFTDPNAFDASEMRQSVGLSAKWFSFIGPIEFSYAVPINDEPGDDTRNFQFALGASF
ncbi:MAG: outer membrane protein insertion porin family [Planctomycetota bacterium]